MNRMSMYQQKNSMGLGLGGWCVEERDNSVVCPKPRRLGLSDPSFHDHHFRPSLRWPIMYVQIPLYSFPYMKNKFLFFFAFAFAFLFFWFWGWFFCCEIFSHQTEIGDSKAGAELLDIILTKVHISVCVCVCGILLISIISCVCVLDLWVILDVYFFVSEKFMLD